MVESKYFDYIIIFFIFLSSIHLVLDRPLNNPNGKLFKVLREVDLSLTLIFVIEAILKMLALGLLTKND